MMRPALFGFTLLAAACSASPAPEPVSAPPPAAAPAPVAPAASDTGIPVASSAPSVPAPKPAAPETPEAIHVPSPATVAFKGNATGVQIYTCGPGKENKKAFEWTLKAPDATLTDDAGKPLAKHYGGPTWEAPDGSKVVGAMKAKTDAPDATAVPWLLLEAKSNEGQGVFSNIGWVQRIQTVGGKAPATGCDKAHDGAETRVDYKATYWFYAR